MRCALGLFLGLLLAATLDYDNIAGHIAAALKRDAGERVIMRTDPGVFEGVLPPLERGLPGARRTEQIISDSLKAADIVVLLPLARPMATAEQEALIDWLNQGGARRELHFHWAEGTRRPDGLPAEHPAEFDALYQSALEIDYQALDAAQDRAIEVLLLGTVRIHTPAGTDFMFRVGERPFNKQNGDASAARARAGRVRVDREIELPAGALRVAPIEESAAGNIVLPEARFGDTVAKQVVLQVDNGRITRVRAEQGQEAVEAALAAGGEAARRFGSFALGFNPKLAVPAGSALVPYYGYGAGVVRLSFGDNQELGGNVRGTAPRWLFFTDASMHVDYRYLVRDGKLEDRFSAVSPATPAPKDAAHRGKSSASQ